MSKTTIDAGPMTRARQDPAMAGGGPAMARATVGSLIEEGSAFVQLARKAPAPHRAAVATAIRPEVERFKVIVIGAGQSGLSVGYHLKKRGVPFVILDANERIGDPWRKRWDSLRLFTPARYDSLDGMTFPAPATSFPTKDQMADYIEGYAAHFQLPVRTGAKVDRLWREGTRYFVTAGDARFEADHIVVAMSNYQKPRAPDFASELDPRIVQLHSIDYRNPSQIRDGAVLIAGAGNSGSEIAMELVRRGHRIFMSGRDTGHVPFRIETVMARYLLIHLVFFVFHRVLTLGTPLGRKVRAKVIHKGGPLIRVKPKDLAAAGVERVGKTVGLRDGLPVLEDGRVLDVANVIWCTGFDPARSWIDLPVFEDNGEPVHERGIVANEPGLYFSGLDFLFAFSSTMIQGAGRDARYIADRIAGRVGAMRRSAA